jgi:YbbR domain-containing protein
MVSIYGGDTSGAVEYRITDTIIPITVKGKVDDINAVKTADIRLSIRVNDLEPGQHEVPLIVSVPNTVNLIGEYSVNVMITTTPVTEPTPGL